MNKKVFILFLSMLFCCGILSAQQNTQKSSLQQRAETEDANNNIAAARSLFIRAYEDYAGKGQVQQATECGTRATALYYKENYFKEAFELLRRVDLSITTEEQKDGSIKPGLHYMVTKERMQIYMKMRNSQRALEQIRTMEMQANSANDESLKNDLLYNKAIYYYTFGQNSQGDAVFKEMADKLTASKEYDKIDEVYQTLIANGRKSNNANLVAQTYSNYIIWKDSASAMKLADETGALKRQIADNEAIIAEKDSSLASRQYIIIALCVLAAALAAVLVICVIILLRYIFVTRKQKKAIKLAEENNALKAKFISNISAQLEPTLKKLDSRIPEVQALLDFSSHIQKLSQLENTPNNSAELEDTQIQQFCEEIIDQIRGKVKDDVTLMVNAPKMNAKINREYVSHILLHLLNNAAEYTPAGGNIWLDFKKRGAHTQQFVISDTGCGIPEEKREDVFKPFLEIKDLTTGDALGLPICKEMAKKMNGDLDIDPKFTKGTRFVLDLHT
ncbi:MAG: sensor histidine kinase [Bacteroidaceae bacterium]|nr:sensor histidine kinase [Bacteroidaceae bacterium]